MTPVDLGNSDEDAGRLITQAELLAGVSDVDNLPAELAAGNLAVTGGSGTLVDHADGTWTFTPTLNWSGGVTFGFDVSDGSESTAKHGHADGRSTQRCATGRCRHQRHRHTGHRPGLQP